MDEHVTFEALTEAWDALYDSLPARWHIGKPTYDTRSAGWTVTAWGPSPVGGAEPPQSVTGTGDTEMAALRDLDDRLRGMSTPTGGPVDDVLRRLRMAYVDGAEAFSREALGRGLTSGEFRRVIQRYEVR